ncbi:unnamed protein product [Pleuronectes platessa]|uniref:Uncharacterized protein n=1 Tax=Pleuronectes platessa TaxID=8262 RepID=A0A9N7UZU9_PLEPL|nr:unnamed protein product [Pleuronectes platessa]
MSVSVSADEKRYGRNSAECDRQGPRCALRTTPCCLSRRGSHAALTVRTQDEGAARHTPLSTRRGPVSRHAVQPQALSAHLLSRTHYPLNGNSLHVQPDRTRHSPSMNTEEIDRDLLMLGRNLSAAWR